MALWKGKQASTSVQLRAPGRRITNSLPGKYQSRSLDQVTCPGGEGAKTRDGDRQAQYPLLVVSISRDIDHEIGQPI